MDRKKDDLAKQGFDFTTYYAMEIVHLPSEEPFCRFRTNGIERYQSHMFARIEYFEVLKGKRKLEIYLNIILGSWENPENFPYKPEEAKEEITESSKQAISESLI